MLRTRHHDVEGSTKAFCDLAVEFGVLEHVCHCSKVLCHGLHLGSFDEDETFVELVVDANLGPLFGIIIFELVDEADFGGEDWVEQDEVSEVFSFDRCFLDAVVAVCVLVDLQAVVEVSLDIDNELESSHSAVADLD